MFGLIILAIVILGSICWIWVGGMDYMRKNYPDYDGHDWLDWTEEEKKDIV